MQELARLRVVVLNHETDECLERALTARLTFANLVRGHGCIARHAAPDLLRYAPGTSHPVLRLADVCDGQHAGKACQELDLEAAFKRAESGNLITAFNLLLHRLDVAGEMFDVQYRHRRGASDETQALQSVLLETWCEELDNYLAAIVRAAKNTRSHGHSVPHSGRCQSAPARRLPSSARGGFYDLLLAYIHESDRLGNP